MIERPELRSALPCAELHAVSNYSFLCGASAPEELVKRALELGLSGLALTERDGLYSAVQFAEAARNICAEQQFFTVFGAQLSVEAQVAGGAGGAGSAGYTGRAGGAGRTLTVLARGYEGYRRLSHVITDARMVTGTKDAVVYPPLEVLAAEAGVGAAAGRPTGGGGPMGGGGPVGGGGPMGGGGYWRVLVSHEWIADLPRLISIFGPANLTLEYQLTFTPDDADQFADLDAAWEQYGGGAGAAWEQYGGGAGAVAANGLTRIISAVPTAATRAEADLAAAKQALSRRETLAEAYPNLHPAGATWLRSARAIAQAAPGREALIAHTAAIAAECAFDLRLAAPGLPQVCGVGENRAQVTRTKAEEMDLLRELVATRAPERYRTRSARIHARARAQAEYELEVIEQLDFPGYFLIVCDIVDFCRRENIYCQGRGSAANSVVCFCLGITNVEPIHADLLFERFLSPERDGPPDIDVDIEAGRREEVIQYVYTTYGRDNAAQVANVITYRRRGALRDAARALGFEHGAQGTATPPPHVIHLAEQFHGQPRHLGIHSCGMVICDRPIADVVPTEWARKEKRSVIQWDKDDATAAGLVKFDLLGLGMLSALHATVDLIQANHGVTINLWELDLDDPAVYDLLCRADTVGVFQVESRAQMSALPRLKPRTFFDIVVEVALIRPGPIQGGSVHPYIRRRSGEEPVTYDHPCLQRALGKTLGVPLFQEQLMRIAQDAAGFTGAQADQLRRAMGAKRSQKKMAALKERFFAGLAREHAITGEVAENLWTKMVSFASYGFPESHAQSFASLVYFSAWLKVYYPLEFIVGLLRSQPMGFYSPQSLITDARRHGVSILPICVQHSGRQSSCEYGSGARAEGDSGAIRLGLDLVAGLGEEAATRIERARDRGGACDDREAGVPFASIADLSRRAELTVSQVEALAKAGALEALTPNRREAVWEAGVAATEKPTMLPGVSVITAPALPGMSAFELMAADIAHTGVSAGSHPMSFLREQLATRGIVAASQLAQCVDGTRVRVAGVVTHRQRPRTAKGVTFFGVEDETGLMNVIVSPGLLTRYRTVALSSKALLIRGIVHNATGAITLTADLLEPLPLGEFLTRGSRDFR